MTEADFLAAVIANPDDDSPRLIFADWLSENGQDEWAELVRVQCELANNDDTEWVRCSECDEYLDGGEHKSDCRLEVLKDREAELLVRTAERKDFWLSRVPPAFAATNPSGLVRRGFVELVYCQVGPWYQWHQEVRAATPVREVRFVGGDDDASRLHQLAAPARWPDIAFSLPMSPELRRAIYTDGTEGLLDAARRAGEEAARFLIRGPF